MKYKLGCLLLLGIYFHTLGYAQHFIIQSQNFQTEHPDDPIGLVRMSFEQGAYFQMIPFSPDGSITATEFKALLPKGRSLLPQRFHQNEYGMVEQGVIDVLHQQIKTERKASPLSAVITYGAIDQAGQLDVFCQFRITLEAESEKDFAHNPNLTNVEITEGDKFRPLTASDIEQVQQGNEQEWEESDLPPLPPPASKTWKSQHHQVSAVYKPFWQLGRVIDSTHLVQVEWVDRRTGYMYIIEKYKPTPFMTLVSDEIWYPLFANQFVKTLENVSFTGRKSVEFRGQAFEQLTFMEGADNSGATVGLAYIRRTKEWVYKIYFIYFMEGEEGIPKELLEINEQMKWE